MFFLSSFLCKYLDWCRQRLCVCVYFFLLFSIKVTQTGLNWELHEYVLGGYLLWAFPSCFLYIMLLYRNTKSVFEVNKYHVFVCTYHYILVLGWLTHPAFANQMEWWKFQMSFMYSNQVPDSYLFPDKISD